MANNTDQKINDLYSKMLETADTIGKEGITEESIESLKNIESGVNEVALNDEATTEVKIDVPNGEFESRTVMQAYDPITGDQTVVDGYDSIADKIADRHLDNLINGEVTDQDLVNEVLKEIEEGWNIAGYYRKKYEVKYISLILPLHKEPKNGNYEIQAYYHVHIPHMRIKCS